MATLISTIGCVTSFIALIASVVAVSSSQWLKIRYPFFQNDVGVMRHCDIASETSTNYCGDMEMLDRIVAPHYLSLFRSIQAIFILHVVGNLISCCIYLLYVVNFLESKSSFKILTAFNFLTMVFGIYALAIFGTHYIKIFGLGHDPQTLDEMADLGRAFYAACAGVGLTGLTMAFSAMEASEAAGLVNVVRTRAARLTGGPYTLFVDQENA